jgi:drug/metabolite transporter (DMT)-like permease
MPASPGATIPPYLAPLLATLVGNCVYHLASRGAAEKAPPFATLAVVYVLAAALSLGLALTTERMSVASIARSLTQPTALLLAGAVVLIEVGFLFAYRRGAPISSSSLLVNASVAVILALLGVSLLGERISRQAIVGMVVTLTGVVIIATVPAPRRSDPAAPTTLR